MNLPKYKLFVHNLHFYIIFKIFIIHIDKAAKKIAKSVT